MKRSLLFLYLFWMAAATAADNRAPLHLVIVSGIGGEALYSERFARWTRSMLQIARRDLGTADSHISVLTENGAEIDGIETTLSTRDNVLQALNSLTESSEPTDRILLLMIGHGTARGERILFNLPGPDLSAQELAGTLNTLNPRDIAVVNTASASGAFINALSTPGRVVITATAGAAENLHSRFGGFFINAFGSEADRDKDRRVSLLEAFQHAVRRVEENYKDEQRIQTEHALLDDDGDQAGSMKPGSDKADGGIAARWYVLMDDNLKNASQQQREWQKRINQLVDQVELIKRRKHLMAIEDYRDDLESLLIRIALYKQAIRSAGRDST